MNGVLITIKIPYLHGHTKKYITKIVENYNSVVQNVQLNVFLYRKKKQKLKLNEKMRKIELSKLKIVFLIFLTFGKML